MRRKASGISFFTREDGRKVMAYQVESGKWKQHTLASTNDKAAEREGHAWLAVQRADGKVAVGRTIGELWQKWIKLRAASPNLATSTVRDNESHMQRLIVPALGEIPLSKLTHIHCRDFVRTLRDDKASSTVRNVVSTLSSFYEDARAEDWVKSTENVVRHPAVTREMPEAQATTEGTVFLPLAVAQELVLCEQVEPHRRARYAVAFLSGLRDGELQGLTWADVHFDAEVPYIEVTKAFATKASATAYAALTDPKTSGSVRAVPLHEAALAALKWWREDGWPFFVGRDPGPTDAVFASVNGKHWRPKSAREIREDLGRAGQRAKTELGDSIDFHATRRSFSTWLEDHGAAPDAIDRMLGHRGKSTRARHYTAATLGRFAAALALVPFRWQDPARRSPGSTSGGSHNAHIVQPHNEEPKPAQALVAQWTEQRFPKPPVSELESSKSAEQHTETRTVGARVVRELDIAALEHRAGQFDGERSRRLRVRESESRRLDDEVSALMNELREVALGRTEVAKDDRPAYAQGLLARAAKLVEQRQRTLTKGAA